MISQSSLQTANPFAHLPSHRMHYPIEGVVVRVHFPLDPTNRSQKEIEYDVVPSSGLLRGVGRLCNVPLAVGLHGIDADQEIVLKPAGLVIPFGTLDLSTHGPCVDTDGDRVVVQFLNGAASNPIITHILSHAARGRNDGNMVPRYAGKLELLTPGPAGGSGYVFGSGQPGSTAAALQPVIGDRQVHHSVNGTHLALDRNGDILIDMKPHPDDSKGLTTGHVAKKLVVQNEGQDLLRLEKGTDGSIKLTIGNAAVHGSIQVVVADGNQSAAIAEPLQNLYQQLLTKLNAFDAHTHSVPSVAVATAGTATAQTGTTSPGTTGGPAPTIAAPAFDSAIVSAKVKYPSNA